MAWDYLRATLSHLGVPVVMVAIILALYGNPTAGFRVNGHLLDAFPIFNGTRLGCPLFPLLYALSLEPMRNILRTNQNIKCIRIRGTEHKRSAYADDVLLTLSDTLTSIHNRLEELRLFNNLLNLRINYSK